MDQAAGASYELMVVDAWVWKVAQEFIREFSADNDALGFDTIKGAALDNSFLNKRHTAANFLKEFSNNREPESIFSARGQPRARGDLLLKAKDEVARILKSAKPVVSRRESSEMKKVIDKAKKG